MEHRWGKRVDMDVEVILDTRPHGIVHGRVRNASASGLFVETDVRLALHRRVHVIVTLRQGAVTAVQRLSALVVRCAGGGVGLAFHEVRPDAMTALRAAARVVPGVASRGRAYPALINLPDALQDGIDVPAQLYGGTPGG